MCGIAGIIGLDDKIKSKELTIKMIKAMETRGPDAHGVWQNDHKVSFGHARLSIIDLTQNGAQPMISQNSEAAICYNGEVYNFQEIKQNYTNYPYHSQTDTEVLLAGWLKDGEKLIDQLNGMFAFAMWEEKSQKLFLVRDRLGIKPLYYYQKDDLLIFASEIQAILATGLVPKKLDKNSLVDYLNYQTVHAPNTLIENVKMLPAGSFLEYQNGKIQIKSYWKLAQAKTIQTDSETAKREIYNLFHDAVEKRMLSDVPLGAFLSGGIDSSAVVAMMAQSTEQKIKTFSITFKEKEFSEAQYSRLIAKKYNTEHTEIELQATDLLKHLPEILDAYDHPSGDGANSYLISKYTKAAGITVALSGLGGDELFAGYPFFTRFHKLRKFKFLWSLPKFARMQAYKYVQKKYPNVPSEKLKSLFEQKRSDLAAMYAANRLIYSEDFAKSLLNISKFPKNRVLEIIDEQNYSQLPFLSQTSVAEISTYTQNVLLRDMDQMSMQHSLEVRVPFFDHRLVEYAMNISDEVKFPHYPKRLFVEALGELLPGEIVHRPKMGFAFPWQHWLRNELKDFCENYLNKLKEKDVFNADAIDNLWQNFLKENSNVNWVKIWILVVLSHWMNKNGISS